MSIVVAGQVWKRPGVYATVTHLRADDRSPDLARVIATLVETEVETSCLSTREISCDELRAEHVLIFDATLRDPWAVASERRARAPEAASPTEGTEP